MGADTVPPNNLSLNRIDVILDVQTYLYECIHLDILTDSHQPSAL